MVQYFETLEAAQEAVQRLSGELGDEISDYVEACDREDRDAALLAASRALFSAQILLMALEDTGVITVAKEDEKESE